MNYTLNPTTFIEGTYGFIRNELAGGNEGGILVNESANRLERVWPTSRCSIRTRAWSTTQLLRLRGAWRTSSLSFWDGTLDEPAAGVRVGRPHRRARRRNQRYPGWLNINRTQDFAISLTKVTGRHTIKAGFYNNHSFKAQNTGAGGVANLSFQGYVELRQRHQQPARHAASATRTPRWACSRSTCRPRSSSKAA